jgi:hypothetical protein
MFLVPPAVDVLSHGSYTRFPLCIEVGVAPHSTFGAPMTLILTQNAVGVFHRPETSEVDASLLWLNEHIEKRISKLRIPPSVQARVGMCMCVSLSECTFVCVEST